MSTIQEPYSYITSISRTPVLYFKDKERLHNIELTKKLIECTKIKKGAKVFIHPVKNPSLYGVATINKKNKITKIVEKPKKTKETPQTIRKHFKQKKETLQQQKKKLQTHKETLEKQRIGFAYRMCDSILGIRKS